MDTEIGPRFKTLREQAGLSQRELAKRAGVTNGFISQIESNAVSPSVASLSKLLSKIPSSMADFFAIDEPMPEQFFTRKEEQPEIGRGKISYRQVGHYHEGRHIGMLRETLAPGADTGEEMLNHEGQECGVIVEGELELTVDSEVTVLRKGDSYYFDSMRAHRFRNTTNYNCVIVSANSPASF
ncbi:XRE family transcriptional regulator [Vibrio breoganii]|uniref:Cupin domain-containing protein n=1 Tax=Vibrio breoganii TaxID=553239 RepID=A0ABX1U8L7_9VIBR|nr:cupin domain-containing protein [Vibrio breoganii]NMO73180.1 cupin domain-containing protein [Vibrio breoganii]NMR69556.1 cupin domain-containing protein [Vibrio breoganii]PMG02170.1 XRE family transcriptional regulator [Vibrio breoganii]PML90300.1 XRE family transcriptional regulator [Vibrio breoganii]